MLILIIVNYIVIANYASAPVQLHELRMGLVVGLARGNVVVELPLANYSFCSGPACLFPTCSMCLCRVPERWILGQFERIGRIIKETRS